jgi:hypothetical protein
VDEARHVLERLDRIEALGREHAAPETLLAELRALVREAEVWVRREGGPASSAAGTIETLKAAVRERGPPRAPPDPRVRGRRTTSSDASAPSED